MRFSRKRWLAALGVAAAMAGPAAGSASASALDFDGVDDRVTAASDPTQSQTTTARTWEAWVKTTGTGHEAILDRGLHQAPWTTRPWTLAVENGVPVISIMRGSANSVRRADAAVDDGDWHHVAAIWEPGARLDIYIDGTKHNGTLSSRNSSGQVQNPPTILSQIDAATGQAMNIGHADIFGSPSLHFDGSLDGIRYSTGARYVGSFTPNPCPEADSSTVALWTFSEGSGSTTASEGQLTGNAALHNGPTWDTGPSCGNAFAALEFDGVDDRITAGSDPTQSQTTTARTWEAWIKTTSTDHEAIIDRGLHQAPWTTRPWSLAIQNGLPVISVMRGSANSVRYAADTANDGEWHHIAGVWVPGSRLDIYVDGVLNNGSLHSHNSAGQLETNPVIQGQIDAATGQAMNIAHANIFGSPSLLFDGEIDGIRYSLGARYSADFTPEPCPEVDSDTIALWTFSEGSGTTTATDGMLTSNATLHNGPVWIEGPSCVPPLAALSFDGVNDRVNAGLDPTSADTAAPRTWEAWVKTTRTAHQAIIDRGLHQAPWTTRPWSLAVENGLPVISIMRGSATSVRRASATVNDGEWHHIAGVWEPGANLDIYVDGVLDNGTLSSRNSSGQAESPATVLTSIDAAGSQPMNIGHANIFGSPSLHFEGDLDGIRYSEGARYNGTFTPDTTPDADTDTIALWTFSEGTGSTTATEGQTTTAATLVNYPVWVKGP